jgi:DNA primase
MVLFELYGLTNLTVKDGKAVGPCPVHGGDNPRAFHADLERNMWHCFTGCQGGGNQLDLVAKKEGISIRDAALKLQAHFLSPASTPMAKPGQHPDPAVEVPAEAPRSNPPISVKLNLYPDHPHIVEVRRLQVETAEEFGIGYCRRGIMRGCIAIPIRDEDGQLIAYAGRRLKPQEIREHGKYKFPKDFAKNLVLFNLDRALETAQVSGLILVDSFFQVFHLYELGYENVVATMGGALSEAQAELIRELGLDLVYALFDGTDAGRAAAAKVREALEPDCTVCVAHLPESLSVEELPGDVVRWAIKSLSEGIVSLSFDLIRPSRDAEPSDE